LEGQEGLPDRQAILKSALVFALRMGGAANDNLADEPEALVGVPA
jgi:hypothetical protein